MSEQTSTRPAPRSNRAWIVATGVIATLAVVLSASTLVVTDRRTGELEDQISALRAELAEVREDASGGGLQDLLGGLLGGLGGTGEPGEPGDLDDLGGLAELFGGDGLDALLDSDSSAMGTVDPMDPQILACLSPDGAAGLLGGSQSSIPDAPIEEQVDAIAQIVSAEREVEVPADLDIEFVSPAEVSERAVAITEEELDREAAAVDARLLTLLGALEPGTDLAQAQLDALDAGVGGYYDLETNELVIGSEEMDGLGAYVTAHELVHAATDAALGLPDQEQIYTESGSDAAYAALNAIEGDASLYSQRFIGSHLPLTELFALQAESGATTEALAAMPHVVQRQLGFPYLEGMAFSCAAFTEGGWDAVDQTYRELPTTTAQILFPERYLAGETAVDVTDPSPPSGWEELRRDTFGAAELLFLIEAPGDDPEAALSDPLERVGAWAGGEIGVWGRGPDTAATIVLADRGDATPLCDTVTAFYAAAFPDAAATESGNATTFTGGEQAASVTCADGEVTLRIAPEPADLTGS